MKKLLIILAAVTSTAYSQQTNPTGTVMNLSITQSSICLCDSVDISFVFRENNTASTIPFHIWAKNVSNYSLVHSFDYNDIYSMGTSPVGNIYNDTIYFTRMAVPCDLLSKLNVSGSAAIIGFTFKDGISENVTTFDCTVGVEEYELNDSNPIYYNFSGQIVEPKQGELLIKQVGNKRIKVLIQ